MTPATNLADLSDRPTDAAAVRFRHERQTHWDEIARQPASALGGYYHQRLTQIYQFLVAPGQRVLELGCAQGDLLASLKPAVGVGVDFSAAMLERARQRHPHLRYVQTDAHELPPTLLDETFDVIILSDLANDLWDVQAVLQQAVRLAAPHTRIILNTYSRLWEQPLALAETLGLGKPTLFQNWLTVEDLTGLLRLADFEVIRAWPEILCPMRVPLFGALANRVLVKLWPFRELALTNFIIAQPRTQPAPLAEEPLVSVIVPARNEAGNIEAAVLRTPDMGGGTELIFVEGHSKDHTWAEIQRVAALSSAASSSHPRQALVQALAGGVMTSGISHSIRDNVIVGMFNLKSRR